MPQQFIFDKAALIGKRAVLPNTFHQLTLPPNNYPIGFHLSLI